jgi:hypothetical protein
MAGLVGPEGGRGVLGGPAGGLSVTGGAGTLALVGTGAVVVMVGMAVVEVAVVVGAPLVVGAVELELTIRPGAGSSSAFAIWVGAVGSESGCGLAAR